MNPFVMKHLVRLVKEKHELTTLDISKSRLTDAMVKELVKGQWGKLERLILYNNELTALSLDYLKKGKWRTLKQLDLGKNPIINLNGRTLLTVVPLTISELKLAQLQLGATFTR
jgi:hypothetical protein